MPPMFMQFPINSTLTSVLILLVCAFPVLCAPHATHLSVAAEQDQERTSLGTFSSQNTLLDDRVSTGYHAAPLAASLACVTSAFLILLILKVTYLKNRRLRTIHDLPAICTAWSLTDDEGSTYEHPLPRAADTLSMRDVRSLQNQSRHRSSGGIPSPPSAESGPPHRKLRDSIPGVLVGMLGSPDWETRMQRELANHQWRLRRESHPLSIKSQNRRTWPSQRSRAGSHVSTAHSYLRSGPMQPQDSRPSRHSSMRIPNVSSFGEIYRDTFREKKGRPKSLNAVIDQMNSSRSGSILPCSPTSSSIRRSGTWTPETVGSSGFSVPSVPLGHRPSTIREVDTPPPTVTLPQEATFRFRVTDFGDGLPFGDPVDFSPDCGSTGSGLSSANTQLTSPHEHLVASRESSLGGSWRQLRQFPSLPASPDSPTMDTPRFSDPIQVNTVHVRPRYFSEDFYKAKLPKSGFFGVSGLGFLSRDRIIKTPRKTPGVFSPLTLDFGAPGLSDLFVSDLLKLGSTPTVDRQNSGTNCIQDPPVKSVSELSRSLGTNPQILNPLSVAVFNRHHSRVREHVPFSIVTPPPVYLRSARPIERSVRFSPGHSIAGYSAVAHATSLVDLSAPVKPSPLRRVASLGSVGSSRASMRNSEKLSNISKDSAPDPDDKLVHENSRGSRNSSLQVMDVDSRTLRPIASHASLFLDLGGSSPGLDDDLNESYSFGIAESSGINQSFNYTQASSSELVVVMEGCSGEDSDYIVEVRSDAFAGIQSDSV